MFTKDASLLWGIPYICQLKLASRSESTRGFRFSLTNPVFFNTFIRRWEQDRGINKFEIRFIDNDIWKN
ncbi:hypothetical protein DN748_01650 [Sinomicrobium soli]|nr:hypothetical protein DN748_01650 [Sinomicrobium sp. N-1-3-6]